MTFTEGTTYKVKIKGFSFVKDYVSLAGEYQGMRISGILGTREQYPLSQLIILRDMWVELTFRDVFTAPSTGTEYNRFYMGDICFPDSK
jgi:hypothetical protein